MNITATLLRDDGIIPNSRFPLIHYGGAFDATTGDGEAIEALFRSNGWGHSWRNGIYPFHHYHSTAHEVLACYAGSATVQFGGERGVTVEFNSGDAVLIPAGVGHKLLDCRDGFRVVGAYPLGTSHDMCYGEPGERPKADHCIHRVETPASDPVCGTTGHGLTTLWCENPGDRPTQL